MKKKLSIEERALLIRMLEQRRQYMESRNPNEAIKASELILKLQDGEK